MFGLVMSRAVSRIQGLHTQIPRSHEWFLFQIVCFFCFFVELRCAGRGQLFFFSILRFRTMSFRESKLDTVRVVDFSVSFSAWSS